MAFKIEGLKVTLLAIWQAKDICLHQVSRGYKKVQDVSFLPGSMDDGPVLDI